MTEPVPRSDKTLQEILCDPQLQNETLLSADGFIVNYDGRPLDADEFPELAATHHPNIRRDQ